MKKIIALVIGILTLGILGSCNKEHVAKPLVETAQAPFGGDKSDVGSGD